MPQEHVHDLQVGEAVFYARERKVGLIYETYSRGQGQRPGVQLLLSNGNDLSGFSPEEADQFLQPLGPTGLDYHFRNVGQLHEDYRRGVFTAAFCYAEILYATHFLEAASKQSS